MKREGGADSSSERLPPLAGPPVADPAFALAAPPLWQVASFTGVKRRLDVTGGNTASESRDSRGSVGADVSSGEVGSRGSKGARKPAAGGPKSEPACAVLAALHVPPIRPPPARLCPGRNPCLCPPRPCLSDAPLPSLPPPAGRKGRRTVCCNCGCTQTPQWRCGPLGPRTLCNACGVRYKKDLPLNCWPIRDGMVLPPVGARPPPPPRAPPPCLPACSHVWSTQPPAWLPCACRERCCPRALCAHQASRSTRSLPSSSERTQGSSPPWTTVCTAPSAPMGRAAPPSRLLILLALAARPRPPVSKPPRRCHCTRPSIWHRASPCELPAAAAFDVLHCRPLKHWPSPCFHCCCSPVQPCVARVRSSLPLVTRCLAK